MKYSFLLIFTTIVLWGFWGFFGKLAVSRIGLQASFWNAIAFTLIIVFFLLLGGELLPLKKNTNGILFAIIAGLCSGLASIIFYVLLGKKPAGFLIATTALYPLVTILLSVFFLKENLTVTKIAGFILAIAALFLLEL